MYSGMYLSLIDRLLNLSDLSVGGMRRALAISQAELTAVSPLVGPITSWLHQLIRASFKRISAGNVGSASGSLGGGTPSPISRGSVEPMLRRQRTRDFAVRISDSSWSSVSGDQGVARQIPSSIPTWSLVEWALHGAVAFGPTCGEHPHRRREPNRGGGRCQRGPGHRGRNSPKPR